MFSLLFVDDDAGMRALISRALGGRFQVDVASGGDEALQMLTSRMAPYTMLIADMTMARGDGIQLLREARRLSSNTARILITGDHRVVGSEVLARELELFRCLLKPVDLKALYATTSAAVDWHIGASRALAA